jgi:hypothetical protein
MQFRAHDEEPFEIPSEWWERAGMSDFIRASDRYEVNANEDFVEVAISEVAPLRRASGLDGFSKDGFCEERMIHVLQAFCSGTPLPPVEVTAVSKESTSSYRYELHDGVHRYYASIAAGFPNLPVTIKDIQPIRSMFAEEAKAGAKTEPL